ncbi:MAG: tocopherol cyclase family protein, partial [Bacilli bacterium]
MNNERQMNYTNNKANPYFEGYYYRIVTSTKQSIVLIIGLARNNNEQHCFIQIIDTINNESHYLKYDIDKFSFTNDPFSITIDESIFYLDHIDVKINDPIISLFGQVSFSNIKPVKTNLLRPNIMGPFGYIKGMECNHRIYSLVHTLHGQLALNDTQLDFNEGLGYIEKDYGSSFPQDYIWLQSNHNENKANIFLAYALIPFHQLKFNGLICVFEHQDKQYFFTTYNNSKVKAV